MYMYQVLILVIRSMSRTRVNAEITRSPPYCMHPLLVRLFMDLFIVHAIMYRYVGYVCIRRRARARTGVHALSDAYSSDYPDDESNKLVRETRYGWMHGWTEHARVLRMGGHRS
eukprot:COSAG02_NODE_7130_length_3166_cov_9.166309_4_plen_114_part_00